jgi:hypothetical protein
MGIFPALLLHYLVPHLHHIDTNAGDGLVAELVGYDDRYDLNKSHKIYLVEMSCSAHL